MLEKQWKQLLFDKNGKLKPAARRVLKVLLIIAIFMLARAYFGSERYAIGYIPKYFREAYRIEVEYVRRLESEEPNRMRLLFSTKDKYSIDFPVKYWIGGAYTPWGEQPLIQSRRIVHDLPQSISDYAVSRSPYARYDITNIPVEEVIENILGLEGEVEELLGEYDLLWAIYKENIILVYNEKEYPMSFNRETEETIWYSINEKVYGQQALNN